MSLYPSDWKGARWQVIIIITEAFNDVEDLLVIVNWEM